MVLTTWYLGFGGMRMKEEGGDRGEDKRENGRRDYEDFSSEVNSEDTSKAGERMFGCQAANKHSIRKNGTAHVQ